MGINFCVAYEEEYEEGKNAWGRGKKFKFPQNGCYLTIFGLAEEVMGIWGGLMCFIIEEQKEKKCKGKSNQQGGKSNMAKTC